MPLRFTLFSRLCLAVAAAALCCCGCAGGNLPLVGPQVTDRRLEPFESDFSLQYGTLCAQGHFSRTGPGDGAFAFTAPEALSGLTVDFTGETVVLQYLGLEAAFAAGSVPDGAAREVVAALDALACQQEQPPVLEGEDALYTGDSGRGPYALTVNRQSGAFLRLEAGDPAAVIEFENFAFPS